MRARPRGRAKSLSAHAKERKKGVGHGHGHGHGESQIFICCTSTSTRIGREPEPEAGTVVNVHKEGKGIQFREREGCLWDAAANANQRETGGKRGERGTCVVGSAVVQVDHTRSRTRVLELHLLFAVVQSWRHLNEGPIRVSRL
jgi:hypothetical protein